MKSLLLSFVLFVFFTKQTTSQTSAFKQGEWLRYRVHYGFITAGEIIIEVKSTEKKHIKHIIGKGISKGLVHTFFKVRDVYETFFDTITQTPIRFIRNVYEGGYIIDRKMYFDTKKNVVRVHENNTDSIYKIPKNIQDAVSLVYYLRNLSVEKFKPGESINIPVFVDRSIFKFKLKLINKEYVKTKFGKTSCLVFVPFVKKGRIFKKGEKVKVWVSEDKNKIPIKFEVKLTVGSLKIELDAFKGLSHIFTFVSN